MSGNANTKKTDEVENLKFLGVSTERTTCRLLPNSICRVFVQKAFHFVVILQHIHVAIQVISTCLYTDEFIVHR